RLAEADLGYDWPDTVWADALERSGFTPLPQASRLKAHNMTMINPDKRFPQPPASRPPAEIHAERKEWIAIMIRDCRAAGVEFVFGAEILGPMLEGERVRGLRVRIAGTEQVCPADLVIDAAGVESPVRLGLPAGCGIPGALPRDQLFYAWRGFYDRLPGPAPQSEYNLYFCHQGRKGLSWVIAEPASMDLLVGNIGQPLPEAQLAEALADLRRENPLVGEKLLRGGGRALPIPVRRPLGLMVAEGYAATGDSACMADPFSGCGICSSMRQGRLLAQVLLECEGDYSLPKLWAYQVRTFTELKAEQRAATDVMRCVMLGLRPAEIDLMFERGLMAMRGGVKGLKSVLRLLRNVDHPGTLWKLAQIPMRTKAIKAIIQRMPQAYDPAAVAAWVKDYEGCKMR
ncbi:MAG: hypothetical protein FWC27_01785, partial [Firmicutes bacterium]|nr:hypothetical protein [Bacillota bacterium]